MTAFLTMQRAKQRQERGKEQKRGSNAAEYKNRRSRADLRRLFFVGEALRRSVIASGGRYSVERARISTYCIRFG